MFMPSGVAAATLKPFATIEGGVSADTVTTPNTAFTGYRLLDGKEYLRLGLTNWEETGGLYSPTSLLEVRFYNFNATAGTDLEPDSDPVDVYLPLNTNREWKYNNSEVGQNSASARVEIRLAGGAQLDDELVNFIATVQT